MRVYQVSSGENSRYEIQITAVACGEDYTIAVCGGSRHHIGATAVGFGKMPDGSAPKYSAPVSSIVCLNHKDDQVARMLAQELADWYHATVTVTVGIHIDQALAEELKLLQENVKLAVKELIQKTGK